MFVLSVAPATMLQRNEHLMRINMCLIHQHYRVSALNERQKQHFSDSECERAYIARIRLLLHRKTHMGCVSNLIGCFPSQILATTIDCKKQDTTGGFQTPKNATFVDDLLGFEPQPQTSHATAEPYALHTCCELRSISKRNAFV